MADELKPCPFCGSDTCETALTRWNPVMDRWRVVCGRGCHGEGPARETEAEAITAWNTRTDTQRELIEALRDLAEAARNACDAKQHPSLTEALFEATALIAKAGAA